MSEMIEKKYKCPVCGKTFTKPHTVKVHMRLHTGQRPHECHICPKTFVTSSALKDHLISHMNSRDFVCNRCGAKFKHKGTLKRHQAQHEEYEKKRDHQESIETAVVYESHLPFEQPGAKYFIITAEEAQEKFPYLQEFFGHRSQEINTHAIISDADCHTTVVKQEKFIDDDEASYGAAVLELTENNVYEEEGINVKVYNVSGDVQDHTSVPPHSTEASLHSSAQPLFRPRIGGSPKTPIAAQSSVSPLPDVAVGYGSHVSRILRLLDSQEKQAALIQKLNKTIHSFIVTSRK